MSTTMLCGAFLSGVLEKLFGFTDCWVFSSARYIEVS